MIAIETALAEFRPSLVASYSRYILKSYNQMVVEFGPGLKGVHNSWSWARLYRETVMQFIGYVGSSGGTSKVGADTYLKVEAIELAATEYADATLAAWKTKIEVKLVDLIDAKVRRLNGNSFQITGTNALGAIAIEQNMILNQSAKGTLYNQFPARIYVNGKFTSAAKYAKALGKEVS